MKEVDYYYSDDCGIDMLMKRLYDPEKGILTGFIWNVKRKAWVENWERTCGYFMGFEPAHAINSEKSGKYMVRYGATEQEADAVINKDLND